jgi:small multidrug resistance pump
VHYVYLVLAIVCEVIATTALKAADGFRVPGPTLIVLVGYSVGFFLLSLALRTVPVGIAYAIWSGIGQVLVMLFAWIIYKQTLDVAALVGIALILSGVLVLAIFSESMPH